jgi:hypothetical protein
MNQHNKEFDNTIVEKLVWLVFGHIFFGDIFLNKLKQVAQQLKVQVPILILFQDGR